MTGKTCEKCGAPGEYRQDVGSILCGSCAFDAAFERGESDTRKLFKKYADGADEEPKPTGGAA
jgi:uncharacterized Zn finger protein (UPF0148 family)